MPDDWSLQTPARRFVAEQAWWIASEICRRHPRLRIIESWPLMAHYHGLEVSDGSGSPRVFMNYEGSIHFLPGDEYGPQMPWAQAFAAESPHEFVNLIESRMNWETSGAFPTSPRTLTYRVLSRLLTLGLNDRERWLIESGRGHTRFSDWTAFAAGYVGAEEILRGATNERGEPGERCWVVSRGKDVVALITDNAELLRQDRRPLKLLAEYRRRRRLDDVLEAMGVR